MRARAHTLTLFALPLSFLLPPHKALPARPRWRIPEQWEFMASEWNAITLINWTDRHWDALGRAQTRTQANSMCERSKQNPSPRVYVCVLFCGPNIHKTRLDQIRMHNQQVMRVRGKVWRRHHTNDAPRDNGFFIWKIAFFCKARSWKREAGFEDAKMIHIS